ncbi:MAG: DUF3880 domain-containing protein [Lachnospiraceae bacterium]|nr:DUF3880 domain-containing protein [Lachnospiraceae bacterium]MCH4112328.1 DUF3880 domain-containing protein [Lachnospiraceae bacterium]MCI1353307.1 DUF3880 domain-containing protein [Lachnospiraceae bacterium]MCI1367307.1 DUF3880 domain-containing protein [Lachnospiraceae bacterium]MCI1421729.1 DUF3880 domain-containing protein [Lachnospiraceae bacterium]
MKVLYIYIENYLCNQDMIAALEHYEKNGIKTRVVKFPFSPPGQWHDAELENRLEKAIEKETPDFVFSFNYFPVVSNACERKGIRYVSWLYDNPQVSVYSCSLIHPCNSVFLFDHSIYEEFASQGFRNVFFLPMAAPVRRLDAMHPTLSQKERFGAAVSFVGSLYTEEHNFYDRMIQKLDPYTVGYLEGVMRAQMQVQGASFVRDCLTDDLIRRMQEALPLYPHADGVETPGYLFTDYVLNRKITAMDRMEILRDIGAGRRRLVDHPVMKVFTRDPEYACDGFQNMGTVDPYAEAPYVYKSTKINLNITLRSIRSGIPLRCFDIMGAGGFLLSNYQEDFLYFFKPDKDFVFYESRDDLMNKIALYLRDEELRMRIAESGYRKVASEHTFDIRVRQILDVIKEG